MQPSNNPYNGIPPQAPLRSCPKCGNLTSARFCGRCGTYIPQEVVMPVYQPAPQPAPIYYPSPAPVQNQVSHSTAAISIIAGVASVVLFFADDILLFLIGFICCIVAIAIGFQAIRNKDNWGTAGLVTGIVMLILFIIILS